jgi:hypothetical protein
VAFVQQLPALIGVVIGALGSYLAVTRAERTRFHREQAGRWQDRRLIAYSDFTRSVKTTVGVLFRVSAHLGNDPHPHPLTPEDASVQLANAADARDLTWETMLLLGEPGVVDAAHAWFGTVMAMERFVRDQVRNPDEWSALLESQRITRARFYDSARRDLALPPGHPGQWRRGTDQSELTTGAVH